MNNILICGCIVLLSLYLHCSCPACVQCRFPSLPHIELFMVPADVHSFMFVSPHLLGVLPTSRFLAGITAAYIIMLNGLNWGHQLFCLITLTLYLDLMFSSSWSIVLLPSSDKMAAALDLIYLASFNLIFFFIFDKCKQDWSDSPSHDQRISVLPSELVCKKRCFLLLTR